MKATFTGDPERLLAGAGNLFEMQVVLATIARQAQLELTSGSREAVMRRAITFAPSRGGRVGIARHG